MRIRAKRNVRLKKSEHSGETSHWNYRRFRDFSDDILFNNAFVINTQMSTAKRESMDNN